MSKKKNDASKEPEDPDLSEVGLTDEELDETLDILENMKRKRLAKEPGSPAESEKD